MSEVKSTDGLLVLRNKFSHTLALLFTRSYPDLWPTFITDLIGAMRTIPNSGGTRGSALNLNLTTLMLRVLNEVSGEIAAAGSDAQGLSQEG